MTPFKYVKPRLSLFYRITGRTSLIHALQQLGRSQWYTTEHIEQYQLIQFQKLIDYALYNIPYYRNLLVSLGIFNGNDITSLSDIQKIPVLTKDTIRQNFNALKPKCKNLLKNHTGGSSGTPLTFLTNKKYLYLDKTAATIRAYTSAGYRRGDPIGIVWGYDVDLENQPWYIRFLRKYILHFYELNAFKLTGTSMEQFLKELYTNNVLFIKGYANALYEVAQYISTDSWQNKLHCKAIFSEAERLDQHKRTILENAFGGPVFNLYGSREMGTIGIECTEHCGLHINFEHLYVEVNSEGKIIITSFFNYGTPFIRYDIGDYAESLIYTSCPCGRASPRITAIYGRETDNFVTADGHKIHGEFFTHLFYKASGILQFQVIQKSVSHIHIRIVSYNRDASDLSIQEIEGQIRAVFRSDILITKEYVSHIEKTTSGKTKFTISEIIHAL